MTPGRAGGVRRRRRKQTTNRIIPSERRPEKASIMENPGRMHHPIPSAVEGRAVEDMAVPGRTNGRAGSDWDTFTAHVTMIVLRPHL